MRRIRAAVVLTGMLVIFAAGCGGGGAGAADAEVGPRGEGVTFIGADADGAVLPRADAGDGAADSDLLRRQDGAGEALGLPDGVLDGGVDADGPDGPVQELPADAAGEEPVAPDAVKDAVAPDLVEPELPPVDAGPCGSCPAAQPKCVNGVCTCTGTSCPAGKYCKGECVPCQDDYHCGPGCESCASQGGFCAADGSHCLLCDETHPCPLGQKCIEGQCTKCEGLGLCGPQCVVCPDEEPECVGGACVCNAESCGAGVACDGGTCVPCSDVDAKHCGGQCLVCQGPTPHCLGGACALCNKASQCGPGCGPCSGGKPLCAADGSGCVECVGSEDCAAGFVCKQNGCIPNCQAQGCGTDLSAGGEKCSQAFVVGRVEASKTAHFSGDTTEANDDDDLNYFFEHVECWDAAWDNFYRIYLMPGDTLAAKVTPQADVFDVMLKLYIGTECDKDGTGIFEANDDYKIDCYNDNPDGEPESFSYAVPLEGWYTVVVDGRLSDDEDWGPYQLDLTLTCAQSNCCCQ